MAKRKKKTKRASTSKKAPAATKRQGMASRLALRRYPTTEEEALKCVYESTRTAASIKTCGILELRMLATKVYENPDHLSREQLCTLDKLFEKGFFILVDGLPRLSTWGRREVVQLKSSVHIKGD